MKTMGTFSVTTCLEATHCVGFRLTANKCF